MVKKTVLAAGKLGLEMAENQTAPFVLCRALKRCACAMRRVRVEYSRSLLPDWRSLVNCDGGADGGRGRAMRAARGRHSAPLVDTPGRSLHIYMNCRVARALCGRAWTDTDPREVNS